MYSFINFTFCFINQSSPKIIYVLRVAFNRGLINFVNIPGAGAHPKGRPSAVKYSPSIVN
jgi:hypothetical protein